MTLMDGMQHKVGCIHAVWQLSAHWAAESDDSLIQLEDFSEQLRLEAI